MYSVEGVQERGNRIKWTGLCKARARARFDFCRTSSSFVSAEIIGPDGQMIARWKSERDLD